MTNRRRCSVTLWETVDYPAGLAINEVRNATTALTSASDKGIFGIVDVSETANLGSPAMVLASDTFATTMR